MLEVVHFCQCLNFQERSRILLRFADLVEKHNDEIAALETWNNGKPYEQAAKAEVPMLARLFRYYAGEIERASTLLTLDFLLFYWFCAYDFFPCNLQDGPTKSMGSLSLRTGIIMCIPCTNQSVSWAR